MGSSSQGAMLQIEAHAETAYRPETVVSDGSMGSTLLPGFTLIIFRCTSQMQHPLPKPVCDSIDGLQQTVVDLPLLGLFKVLMITTMEPFRDRLNGSTSGSP